MRVAYPMASFTATFAFFLIAFWSSYGVAAVQHRLADAFDLATHPCTDLYSHVCANKQEIKEFVDKSRYGLLDDIARILKTQKQDPVLKLILKAMEKEVAMGFSGTRKCQLKGYDLKEDDFGDPANDYKIGKAFGEMIAHGRIYEDGLLTVACLGNSTENKKLCRVKTSKKKFSWSKRIERLKHLSSKFVKGIIERFAEVVKLDLDTIDQVEYADIGSSDFKKEMLGATYWQRNRSPARHVVQALNENDSDVDRTIYNNVFMIDGSFTAYGNVLFAYTLYTHKDKLNPDVSEEFKKVTDAIKEDVIQNLKDSAWLTHTDKKALIACMNSYKISIGVPNRFRDVRLLYTMLKRYRQAFENTPLDGTCDLEILHRTHTLVRHQLIYEGFGTLDEMSERENMECSIFSKNAFHSDNQIAVFAGYLHVLNDYSLGTGFKYGYIGWMLGHEIFHGFGLEPGKKKHLGQVESRTEFRKQRQCYIDHYGHSKFCIEVRGSSQCQDGAKKAEEGYCDVESARIVFRLLKQALGATRKKRSSNHHKYLPLFNWRPTDAPEQETLLSDDTNEQLKWFFYAVQLVSCEVDPSDEFKYRQLHDDVHPGDQIRANAIAIQMPEFSDLFACKEGDGNYVEKQDQLCALYPHQQAKPMTDFFISSSPNISATYRTSKMGYATRASVSRRPGRPAGRPPKKHPVKAPYACAPRSFDLLEQDIDRYLAGTVSDVKTLKNTVIVAIDNFFRMITYPTTPWTMDFKTIDHVDRVRSKIVKLVDMFSHRLTVVSAFVNGFRLILNAFNGRMNAADRKWPFIKVLLTRVVADVTDEGLLCALGKKLSTTMSQIMQQGCRQALVDMDVQFVAELMTLIKSLGARLGRNRAEGINKRTLLETRKMSAHDFDIVKEEPSECESDNESDITVPPED
ncbi:hypothetical protein QR680_010477 [Steinernema hermaphroditum]|uniref:Peptidase M13 C-terminal domain-containing protein n=1 Tax=Steinernema hermaphroditum TaxID=289476 RepID=A0AA39IQP9_9BILA|nr:hypothetical protein QR680_010477 [Steinernema hermaphroditum]